MPGWIYDCIMAEILTRWSSWVFVPRLSSSCFLQWVWWNQLITWVALQARVSFCGALVTMLKFPNLVAKHIINVINLKIQAC